MLAGAEHVFQQCVFPHTHHAPQDAVKDQEHENTDHHPGQPGEGVECGNAFLKGALIEEQADHHHQKGSAQLQQVIPVVLQQKASAITERLLKHKIDRDIHHGANQQRHKDIQRQRQPEDRKQYPGHKAVADAVDDVLGQESRNAEKEGVAPGDGKAEFSVAHRGQGNERVPEHAEKRQPGGLLVEKDRKIQQGKQRQQHIAANRPQPEPVPFFPKRQQIDQRRGQQLHGQAKLFKNKRRQHQNPPINRVKAETNSALRRRLNGSRSSPTRISFPSIALRWWKFTRKLSPGRAKW